MKLTQFAVDDGPHNSDGLLVDVLLSDITESGETLDASELERAAGAFASKA